ncbi:EAL domain-containing protein [Acidovorax lacteus]|uniref:EAL domain-containing protein n=1 Tax=Acidovorax lacteus TaxID=1924988 RepID=A0ABP8LIF2_9BURK
MPDPTAIAARITPEELGLLKSRLFEVTPMGLCMLRQGVPLAVNQHLAAMLGGAPGNAQSDSEALQAQWPDLWPQLVGLGKAPKRISLTRTDGKPFVGRAYMRPLPGEFEGIEVITVVDDTHTQRIAFSADWRARMLEQTEAMGRSGSAEIDLDNGQAVLSQGLHRLLCLSFDPAPMAAWRLLRWVPPAERPYVASIWRAAITDEPFEFQHRLLRPDGSKMEVLQRGTVETDAAGRKHGYFILQDITAQREAEQRIQELANHDEVTGLANRTQLLDRIDQAVHAARWDPQPFLLLSIEVDEIDHLRRAMGYGAGDALAMAVAARLCVLAENGDTVARVDGGEFAILLDPRSAAMDPSGAHHARKIVEALARPERLGAAEIVPRGRVGVARFPADAEQAGQLLEAAQTARMGSPDEEVAFYTPQTRATALRRIAIESGLRHAVERDELFMRYQLQADLVTGELAGADAMLHWHSAELGEVPRPEFLSVARQTGLIVMLGNWARDAVCRQLSAWDAQGMAALRVSMRITPLELSQPDIVERIRGCLERHRVPGSRFGIEISEQVLVSAHMDIAKTLSALRALGLEITLGDFGSGATNLRLLRTLPVDVIKVHRSCVPDVTAATGDVSLTRAILNLAHSLHLKVLAEGVETPGQLTLLVANGCDRMQGPVFALPGLAEEVVRQQREGLRLPAHFLRTQRERTLLLVDDEPNIVSALKRLFRRDGYRIVTAHSGVEGLQRMAEYEVDVVLSDQRMPGMTGVEFLRRAKELYPDTVRMVLSGYTELQSITDAINEGAIYRFLTKPWDDEHLREHVQEAFRQKGMADENKRLAGEVVSANEALAQVNERLEMVLATQKSQIDREEVRANTARDMVDLLPVPVLGVDPDGTVVLVNREAQRLWGPQAPLLGEQVCTLLRPHAVAGVADMALPLQSDAPALPSCVQLQQRRWLLRMQTLDQPSARGTLLVLTEAAQRPH